MPVTPKQRKDDKLSVCANEQANELTGHSLKVYADNPKNRKLGRAGKPMGSMPETTKRRNDEKQYENNNGASEQTPEFPGQNQKVYADNPKNDEKKYENNNGAGGRTFGSNGQSPKVYVDNPKNRQLGRVGKPKGSMPDTKLRNEDKLSKSNNEASEQKLEFPGQSPKVYADNPKNRKLGRVGKPKGSMPETTKRRNDEEQIEINNGASEQKPEFPGQNQKVYADNPKNRKHGRAGKPKGSMPDTTKQKHDFKFEQTHESIEHNLNVFVDYTESKKLGHANTYFENDHSDDSSDDEPENAGMAITRCLPTDWGQSTCNKTMPAIPLNIQPSESSNTCANNAFNRELEYSLLLLGEPKNSMNDFKNEDGCKSKAFCPELKENISLTDDGEIKEILGEPERMTVPRGKETNTADQDFETDFQEVYIREGLEDKETTAFTESRSFSEEDEQNTNPKQPSGGKVDMDNYLNRKPDTDDISNETSDTPKSVKTPKFYVDNALNRKLGRVGMLHGTFGAVVHKEDETVEAASVTEVYKDTEQNRRLKRVGLPKGTVVFSETKKSIGIQLYQDSSLNRRLGRVGLPRGSKPAQKKSSVTKKIPELLSRLRNAQVTNYEELECKSTGNDSDEDSESRMHSSIEAVEKAQLQYNRFLAEKSWKRLSEDPLNTVPKTVPSVLKDFVGKKIPFSELNLQRPIGRGGFGEVYFAKWKETVVAVKKLRVENTSEKKIIDFSQEVMTFCTLNHDNIVKFIGACVEMPNICIVMEYMQMSLFEAIHSCEDVDFSNEERLSILQQICQGIRYLHSKRIAHCDLKTPNVLLDYVQDELCSIKITDFGLSMVKNDALTSTTNSQELVRNIGTPRYSAPEILRGELHSAKDMMMADIYSLGLVFFEVIFEEEPFPDYSRDQLKQQVGRLGNKPTVPAMLIHEDLQDIMERAWSYSPRERPRIADICNAVTDCTDIYLKQVET